MSKVSGKGSKDLFSVIVLHYNQQKYVQEALDSVFMQNYGNIELILADDFTLDLNIESIQSYIEAHKTKNISSVKYQMNNKNLGTVRNVNQALRSASGKYALFFAADDSLYDENVISNFEKALSELLPDQYMVCAQCDMMDEMMDDKLGDFVNVSMALRMNQEFAAEQYKRIVFSCCYAMGATAFKMSMLKDKGYFDETYNIIEDWSYYLSLTLNGSKIIYSNFDALKHRDGGVSHFNKEVLPPHVIEYKNDSLLIQERLILPYLSAFPLVDQVKLLERYERERTSFASLYTDRERPSRINLVLRHKKLYMRKALWWFMDRIFYLRDRCIHWAKLLFPAWAVLIFLKFILTLFTPGEQFLFVNTQVYNITVWIIFTMLAIDIIALTVFMLMYGVIFLRRITKEFFSSKH